MIHLVIFLLSFFQFSFSTLISVLFSFSSHLPYLFCLWKLNYLICLLYFPLFSCLPLSPSFLHSLFYLFSFKPSYLRNEIYFSIYHLSLGFPFSISLDLNPVNNNKKKKTTEMKSQIILKSYWLKNKFRYQKYRKLKLPTILYTVNISLFLM